MFNTSILDVAIGMIFIYLLLSLLCTATNELIELMLKKRAVDLERGIRELLVQASEKATKKSTTSDDSKSETPDIVEKIYNHPLINSLYGGTYGESGIKSKFLAIKRTQLPSYIPARNFALALMDTIIPQGAQNATATTSDAAADKNQLAALRAGIQKFGNQRLEQALTPLIDAAAGDVARARLNIEEWFNSSMDRVSGWYKRRSHVTVLILGLLVAIAVNADSALMVRKLASDRALRDQLVASANAYAQKAAENNATTPPDLTPTKPCLDVCKEETPQCRLKKTQCEIGALGLPLGWSSRSDPRLYLYGNTKWGHFKDHIFGWLLTALALSLGAPFWFDILNKIIVIRSTVKPKEKSPEDKSKD